LRLSRERKERERGERGSTYKKRAATTLVCYNTSIPQRGIASKSRN